MEGVVVLPLRVLRIAFRFGGRSREATFGPSARPTSPLRWQDQTARPKRSAASFAASATIDNAKHARLPRFGEEVAKLEAKPFARHHAFGRDDNRSPNLGSSTGQRTTPAPNDSVNPDRAPSSLGSTTGKPEPSPSGEHPVPNAQHADPRRRCSCPAHYAFDRTR
jgi:hypothetical protein